MTTNTVFENKIIETKAQDILQTSVNSRNLMTVDNSLSQQAGMIKSINTYKYTGAAEEVGVGAGNSTRGGLTYTTKDYEVKMVQQAFDYQDEDFLKDNTIVDNGIKGATQMMANKMTDDFFGAILTNVAEIPKHEITDFNYDAVVDAIAKLQVEDESKLFLVISPKWKAAIRKDEDFKAARMGEVIYNGQVGTICGIPVIVNKALATDGTFEAGFVMTKDAVTLFMKKDIEIEQARDADTRTNSIYLRSAYVTALTDATKVCLIQKGQA